MRRMLYLKVVKPVPIEEVLGKLPNCKHIGTTGGKATEVLLSLLPEKTNFLKPVKPLPLPLGQEPLP